MTTLGVNVLIEICRAIERLEYENTQDTVKLLPKHCLTYHKNVYKLGNVKVYFSEHSEVKHLPRQVE